jgi:hypothetical protein
MFAVVVDFPNGLIKRPVLDVRPKLTALVAEKSSE